MPHVRGSLWDASCRNICTMGPDFLTVQDNREINFQWNFLIHKIFFYPHEDQAKQLWGLGCNLQNWWHFKCIFFLSSPRALWSRACSPCFLSGMKQLAQDNLLAGRVLSSPADSVAITCICSAKVSLGKLQRNISGFINIKSAPHFLDHVLSWSRTIRTIKGVFSAPHCHPHHL